MLPCFFFVCLTPSHLTHFTFKLNRQLSFPTSSSVKAFAPNLYFKRFSEHPLFQFISHLNTWKLPLHAGKCLMVSWPQSQLPSRFIPLNKILPRLHCESRVAIVRVHLSPTNQSCVVQRRFGERLLPAAFLLGLVFYTKDGGCAFLRNLIKRLPVLQYSSLPQLREPQYKQLYSTGHTKLINTLYQQNGVCSSHCVLPSIHISVVTIIEKQEARKSSQEL